MLAPGRSLDGIHREGLESHLGPPGQFSIAGCSEQVHWHPRPRPRSTDVKVRGPPQFAGRSRHESVFRTHAQMRSTMEQIERTLTAFAALRSVDALRRFLERHDELLTAEAEE